MNQAIQFPELEYWDNDREAVCFPALADGFRVECVARKRWLLEQFGAGADADCLTLFRTFRWEIEEAMERKIADRHDYQGCFYLP
ncbi:DUF1488 domain-containing protein [Acerihabitans sp. KWT182]|uniref:DUF1488 domain-containing protein n=1 Tax=Acerihabitans sp. KWT182 TaxID=3157919 RepID=A0AAU7Q9R1_9GAMM